MNVLDDMMLIYQVAKLYYIDKLGQNEIAKIIGISRPQVSRLIKRGLEIGIVKIEVNMPESFNLRDMEKELSRCLSIDNIHIIPSSVSAKKDHFSNVAVKYVEENIEQCNNIGIGWGRSIYNISRNLSYHMHRENTTFYPLIGHSGDTKPYLQISNILNQFSERYQSKKQHLNLPVFIKNEDINSHEKQLLEFFQEKWKTLDAAVVSIGAFNSEHEISIESASSYTYLKKQKFDIVGDLLAHLFLKGGGELTLPNYIHVACPLKTLKNIPNVIAICKGIDKVDSIYHISKRGYISTLIIDDITARAILEKYAFRK